MPARSGNDSVLPIPDELVREIVDHFDSVHVIKSGFNGECATLVRQNQNCLLNLCLVSSQFRNIAQPILARSIWDNGERLGSWQMAETFAKDPCLAKRVKAISVDATGHDEIRFRNSRHESLKMSAALEARASDIQAEGSWISSLRQQQQDPSTYGAELGLMLMNLSSVEVLQLRIVDPNSWSVSFAGLFAFLGLKRSTILPKLRAINIDSDKIEDYNEDCYGFTPHQESWTQILGIPSLRYFRVSQLWASHENPCYIPLKLPEQVCNVTCLDLNLCHVCSDFLRSMMQCFKQLKLFRYEWRHATIGSKQDIGLVDLIDNLALQKSTLEKLILDVQVSDYFKKPIETIEPLGSFKVLEQLRYLEISPVLLLGKMVDRQSRSRPDDSGVDADDAPSGDDDSSQQAADRAVSEIVSGSGQARQTTASIDELGDARTDIFPPRLKYLQIYGPDEEDELGARALWWVNKLIPRLKDDVFHLEVLDLREWVLLTSTEESILPKRSRMRFARAVQEYDGGTNILLFRDGLAPKHGVIFSADREEEIVGQGDMEKIGGRHARIGWE